MIFLCDVLKDSCIRSSFINRAKDYNIELLMAKRRAKTTGRLLNTYYITKTQFEKIKESYYNSPVRDTDFEFVLGCIESNLKEEV